MATVEKIYQKKTQLEHILLRPDTYIGSVEPVSQNMWVWDEGSGMVNREITYVPGLYKIFDEILVNAADNKQRDPKMSTIKIEIDSENNKISVWNDGKGIPVVEHKEEKLHIPEMIFGHLLTSSNYNDTDKKVTGGRNGFGAKLCNIFSSQFTVETSSREYKKKYKQTWSGNMSKAGEKKIISSEKSDYTCITFKPDLAKFNMTTLDRDIVALMTRRAYDIAGATHGVKVYLNGMRLPVSNFKDYVQLYVRSMQENGSGDSPTMNITHEKPGVRWEVCLTLSDKGFQQISFVNSIATTKGGRHVDYVMDQITKKLIEVVKKKNKGGVDVKPYQIKNHCFVFVNCLIENPTFDSQTKENMTLQAKKFGSKCELTDKFLKSAANSGIVDSIMNWVKFKAQSQLQKNTGKKSNKLKGVPKLDDANDAGTKNSMNCTLILTEGDSAKTLAVSGLSVVGRDKYGVFPLRGKLLNVRDANHKQIMENAEINNIIKIMGLKYGKKYKAEEDLKSLRYGKLMIMTDQDHDGSHIKGLLINFIHSNWPDLIQRRLLEEFITPIVKVSKGSETLSFYTIPEFEEWQSGALRPHTWKVKYYKGLGTSTSKEAKSYFAEMQRHRIKFKYQGPDDDTSIDMAFNKKRSDDRKEWLTGFMEERKRCRAEQEAEPSSTLYSAETKSLSYRDFIHKELVMFSCADLERSVPSLVDGLKPGQRKVLFSCLKRNDKREIKVAQLAGSVAELSAYHHGEVSLLGTIVNMAQNYVGSNNLNLLQPIGQFGTRLHGGKDSASPRYIFTMLSPLTRLLFPTVDDNLLTWLYDDHVRVEPMWYCPIIPMILVNGCEGIGTGWSTRVPNHDIRQVVDNCKRFINDQPLLDMKASYKGFRGTMEEVERNKYVVSGEIGLIDDQTIEITELPIRVWTQKYKEDVLEPMANGTDKTPAQISEYKEYNTDTTVRFLVKMSAAKLREAEQKGLHTFFKLQSSLSCNNTLVMFDQFGGLKKYASTTEVLRDFCTIRLRLYEQRKDFLVGMLTAEAKKLSNQARFIVEKIEKKISIFNQAKKKLLELLHERGYDSDPVKKWKDSLKKKSELAQQQRQVGSDEDEEEEEDIQEGRDYNYILNMPLWSLTKERKEDLLNQRDKKQQELEELLNTTIKELWKRDLDAFLVELEKVEQKERDDEMLQLASGVTSSSATSSKRKKGASSSKAKVKEVREVRPSEDAIRVAPLIDPQLRQRLCAVEKKPRVKKEPKAKEIKKEKGATSESTTDPLDEDKPVSLMSRLKNSKKIKTEATTTITTCSATGKKMKQSKINFGKKQSSSGKNPWSTDDDDDVISDVEEQLPQRQKSSRSTKTTPKKYTVDSSSDGFGTDSDHDLDVPAPSKKAEPKKQPQVKKEKEESSAAACKKADAKKKKNIFDDSFGSDSDDLPDEPITLKKKPVSKPTTSSSAAADNKRKATKTTAKPPAKKSKKVFHSSSEEDFNMSGVDDDEVEEISTKTTTTKRNTGARTKKVTKYTFSSDDDDSDF